MKQKNINERLKKEIRNLDGDDGIKLFLEELLIEEISDTLKHAYKEQYKKLISKYINKNSE